MKHIVRMLAVFLVFALACTGCVFAEEQQLQELTIVVLRATADQSETFDQKHWVAAAEEATGIHVNWIELIDGQHAEQLSVMLAGELPDAFFMPLSDSIITQNTKLFVPLNDLIETYAPTVYETYETYVENWREFLTYPDGNIYGLMTGAKSSDQHKVNGVQYINTVWLENLGLEVPTNLDEFRQALEAIRDNDANGNGDATDEIPIDFCNSHWSAGILNFASMWGLPISSGRWYMIHDDDTVTGAVDTDAFRAFLEYFYALGQDGLLNLEGFSQTQEQYYANLDAMKVGTFYGWAPYTFINSDSKLEYDSLAPIAAEGYTAQILANNPNRANRNGFVITTACEDPTVALKFFDYISSQEFARFVYRGEENLLWYLDDAGNMIAKEPTDEELTAFGYSDYVGNHNDTTLMNTFGYNNYYPLLINFLTADRSNPTANISVRVLGVDKTLPYSSKTMSQAIVTAEAQEELDFNTDGLTTMINAFIADSIMNGVTDESWNTYIANLKTYGYDFYIEWYSNYYNGTL